MSFAIPGRKFPSFGLTILNLRSGEFEKTNELNEPLGDFSESDMAFFLSASKNITPRFALGANAKIVRHAVDEFDATGFGVDIGALYQILPSLAARRVAPEYRRPDAQHARDRRDLPGGVPRRARVLLPRTAADSCPRSSTIARAPARAFSAGRNSGSTASMALRLGYSDSEPGGGFSFRVSPDVRFDYAAVDHELGVTHSVALSYQFGGFFASSRAVPEVFSPLGQQSVTKFQLAAKTKSDAQSWSLDIVDKSNQVVRRFSGKGLPPAHIMWDGKDETGLPLADGTYRYQLVVVDENGGRLEGHVRTVEITTEGPKGVVPVITETANQF